ncbi:uncharacterized protein LOC127624374 isoform X2 [Xyrauchen texanus]|nr:uncharacterized protein LOC127624374 isoform X2 [Xyrauchen texanus]XP_051955129.1 uncharacterized protein LOC127624374 isoform X2 [Xyrauchen texanus]
MLREAESGIAPPGSLPNQNAPAPASQIEAPPILNFSTRPVPLPRTRTQPAGATPVTHPATIHPAPSGLIQAAAALTPGQALTPGPALTPAPAIALAPVLTPGPLQDHLEADLNEWPWQTEITQMEWRQQQQYQGHTVRTFVCPYCQEDGMDELHLRDHCNAQHANDIKRVVCPVCVVMPHGDPQYYSRNFIGHLNLRHCYYSEDVTNIHQTDEMNVQCALLASYEKHT